MRKIYLSFSILITFVSNAQVTSNWLIGGNTTTVSVPYFGTNNNNPIVFKTNGLEVFRLKTNGDLKVFNFDDGLYGGVVLTNQNGVLQKLPFGTGSKVLFDDGTWGNIPGASSFWVAGSGSKIYYTAGKVGIGTTTPNFDLDVQGSARITNTLIVNGQLIISDKIQTSRQLKSMRVESDSIMMDSTRALYGKTVIQGDVQAKYNLAVAGNVTTNGFITAKQGLTFDGINGFKFIASTPSSFSAFRIGSPSAFVDVSVIPLGIGGAVFGFGIGKDPGAYSACLPPLTSGNLFANRIIIGGTTNALDIFNGGYDASINLGTDLGYMVPLGTPLRKIQIANLCESDVEICKHPSNVSFLSVGPNVEIGNPTRNNLVTLNIKQIAPQVEAIRVTNALNVTNFLVNGDGSAAFGTTYIPAGYKLAVEGKIIAEEVVVELRSTWPDYVFEKKYKLLPLNELELFVKKENHLPDVPSAKEIESNGIELAKMNSVLLKKVEELTLYIIELDKKVADLQKKTLNK